MGELSGERVVGKRIAPECRVMYQCEKCKVGDVFDAYMGPPTCLGNPTTGTAHPPEFMKPLRLMKGE